MRNLELPLVTLFLAANCFRLVNDEPVNEETSETETPVTPPVTPKPIKAKVTFAPEQQAYVNSLVAEEKRKGQQANERLVTQLETEKNRAGTTVAEKEQLEARIEEIKSEYVTKEQLTEKERKKADKKRDDALAAAQAETGVWKERFTKTTIRRSLVDAALVPEHKADNPAHIVAILFPDTRLVEELDEEGKPTGEYVAKTKVRTVKDGKPTTLDMTATEAVKFLSEQEEHLGLFSSGASGGLGGNPSRPRTKGATDPNSPPEDPTEYRAWRLKNRGAVGAPVTKSSK